jgi:phosphoribosylamine--glycine ligase
MPDGLLPFLKENDRESAMYIMQRTVAALGMENREFRGVLYGGFMLTREGVKLIEFNARFADPESMNVIAVARGNMTDVLYSAAEGRLSGKLEFEKMSTVCRYYVPHGYGEKPLKGSEIKVDEKGIGGTGARLYYGSVNSEGGKLTTTTSRSFALLAKSKQPWDASAMIERAGKFISGLVYTRKDIGTREEMERKRIAGLALHGVA